MDNLKSHTTTEIANDFFYNHRHRIENAKSPNIYIGLIEYTGWKQPFSYYTPSLEVTASDRVPEGMVSIEVPAQKYAVFKYIGLHDPRHTTIEDLGSIYDYIYIDWLGSSGYEVCSCYHFEKIDLSTAREDYCEVELYIPVKNSAVGV
jgi:AraC family transcriptional regulator